jgi:hypothetical protein
VVGEQAPAIGGVWSMRQLLASLPPQQRQLSHDSLIWHKRCQVHAFPLARPTQVHCIHAYWEGGTSANV